MIVQNFDKETMEAIKTLAQGMVIKEVTEEFALDDEGEMKLVKKKVNEKMLPPSVDVVKMIYASSKEETNKYKNMTDEELEREKQRLLQELKKEN